MSISAEQANQRLNAIDTIEKLNELINDLDVSGTNGTTMLFSGADTRDIAQSLSLVRKDMAFVNEYATDEDIEKYDLNGIWDQYHPAWKGDYYLGHKPKFTIDREQNIFFMPIRSGRFDESNRTTALLWINGCHVIVELDTIGGLNPKGIKSDPYRMRWELAGYHPQSGEESKKQIMEILKEALVAYGYSGVHEQLPNVIVEFIY